MTKGQTIVLQREPGRTVVLEEGGSTVRKTFHHEDRSLGGELAAREFDRMARFHEALAGVESATCPRPLEVGSHPEPFVRMERASGIPMQDHLNGTSWAPELYERMAEILRTALVRYVKTFGEPYWDFILRNMFYDPAAHLVTFLDFGVPTIYGPLVEEFGRHHPVDVSLGSMLASSVFEAARPRRLFRAREHRQAPALARAVLSRCVARPEGLEVTVEGVRTVAHAAYDVAASGGGRVRRGWYRYVGPMVGGPSALDGICTVGVIEHFASQAGASVVRDTQYPPSPSDNESGNHLM